MAEALVTGVIANTLLEMFVAAVVGRGAFRAVTVPVLGVMAIAMWLAILRWAIDAMVPLGVRVSR